MEFDDLKKRVSPLSNAVCFGLGMVLMLVVCILFVRWGGPAHVHLHTGRLEDFTPRNYDHVRVLRESTFHKRVKDQWNEQGFSRPFLDQEREAPCSIQAATERNFFAVSIVRNALENAADHYPLRLEHALDAFLEAIAMDPTCATPRLNYIILTAGLAAGEEDSAEGEPSNSNALTPREIGMLNKAVAQFSLDESHWTAKMYLWRAILEEFTTGRAGSRYYDIAFHMDNKLKAEYIHPTYHVSGLLHNVMERPAAPMIRRALVQVLMHYEFAPATGAYGRISVDDALRFKRDWRAKIPNFLPPFVYIVVSRTYATMVDMIRRNEIAIQWIAGYKGSASYESNADPLNQFYNIRIKEFVDRFSGAEVVPSYGYAAGYVDGDVLRPHTDRQACEFTLTILVSAHPSPMFCPLYAQKTPWKIDKTWVGRYEEMTIKRDDVVNVQPQLNELVILRGRAVPHFRPALPKSTYCQTFLAHFTTADKSE
jgi:hypothetical protein